MISFQAKIPNYSSTEMDRRSMFLGFMDFPALPEDGRDGSAAAEFAENFKETEISKTRVKLSGADWRNAGGCSFQGPQRSVSDNEATVYLKSAIKDVLWMENHLDKTGGKLLSLKHDSLCSWDPQLFLPSIPLYSRPSMEQGDITNARHKDLVASAYLFKDVCTTFNIDSSKQSQRAVIIVDPSNNNPLRCDPCPNPQTNIDWGTNKCGMMWFHQMNIKSLSEFQSCYIQNKKQILEHGQRQVPGQTMYKDKDNMAIAGVYYPKTTLFLQYTRNNPGHQLWDSLFSIVTILMSQKTHKRRYFELAISHQTSSCENNIWFCSILRKLGVITNDSLIETKPNILTCFSSLIVPVQGWNHDNAHSTKPIFEFFRQELFPAFQLDPRPAEVTRIKALMSYLRGEPAPKDMIFNLLLYPHNTVGEAGKRRAWLDIEETRRRLAEMKNIKVENIADFAAVSVENQALLFNKADLIIMPHGGQFGNSIFVRRNVIVIEITCGGYSHMAIGKTFAASAGFYHIVERPCKCDSRRDEGNFEFSVDDILRTVEKLYKAKLKPGTLSFRC